MYFERKPEMNEQMTKRQIGKAGGGGIDKNLKNG